MKTISQLLDEIAGCEGCEVRPPGGPPRLLNSVDILPADPSEFFERCGGFALNRGRDFDFTICSPTDVVPSNPLLLGSAYEEHKDEVDRDISAHWYHIAHCDMEHVVIDFHPHRLGRCYDGFWDVHASSDSAIVARSFTDLFTADCGCPYWNAPKWQSLGYAYGGVSEPPSAVNRQ